MDRKKAIYIFAIVDTLVNFLIIALYLLGKLSLTGFVITMGFAITLGVAMLIALGAAAIIIRKTE